MSSQDFHHLKVPLGDIISATDNFNPNNIIGHGGFGPVYKGELSLQKGRFVIAFKRLDPKFGQGNDEFWKEIIMLSKYKHENLVSLLCFCDEGHERILGYEFASRGSLDRYISDTNLSWSQRIKICIGVASALSYLHDPKETQERVFHRDIKSSNILLDDNWTAKVSDFGLSKFGPTLQSQTYLLSNVVGTPGYCDPLYWELGFLTKESDIYSFGVILFEIMCGRLCYEYRSGDEPHILAPTWKNQYDENRLDDIVSCNLKRCIDSDSLTTFSVIAGQCLNRNRKERPTISEIIKELEVALEEQGNFQNGINLVEFGNLAQPPLSYESQEKLVLLLLKGFRYQDTTWLSIDKSERVCEIVSAIKCISTVREKDFRVSWDENSRFDNVMEGVCNFKIEASAQFLIPHVTYNINLLYKLKHWDHGTCLPFKYKLEEETHYSGPFIVELREDGWMVSQLYRFTCLQRQQHFTIECLRGDSWKYTKSSNKFLLEGIEFRPVSHETEENNNMDSNVNWEQKFPNDYIDLIKLSKEPKQWTTKKEAYFLLRQGFLIDNDGEKWLSIDKNMKKRLMVPASSFLHGSGWILKSVSESRFELVAESLVTKEFFVKCKIKSQLLSPHITYSCHLIYQQPENYSLPDGIVVISRLNFRNLSDDSWYTYLNPPQTPIVEPNVDENSQIPSYGRKIEGHPKLRKDGWIECQFFKVLTSTTRTIKMNLWFNWRVEEDQNIFSGLVVQGIEFRPM